MKRFYLVMTMLCLAVLGMQAQSGASGSAGYPEPDGRWTFDNPSDLMANAIEGSSLTMRRVTVGNKSVAIDPEATLTVIDGQKAGDGAVTVPMTTGLRIDRSDSGQDIGTYTLMYDVRLTQVNKYNSLLQTNYNNTNDEDLCIKNSSQVGLNVAGLGYGGGIQLDTWHRIVFVVKDSKSSLYLDGELLRQSTTSSGYWEIGDYFYLFTDDDGDDADIDVTEVAYWEQALTATQVYAMSSTVTDYLSTSTPEVSVVDDALEFTVLLSSSVAPVITLPDWVEAVDAEPTAGVNVAYTYRCQPMVLAGTRTGEIVVAAGSGLSPVTVAVSQTYRGDVIRGRKIGEWTFDNAQNLLANKVNDAPVALRAVLGNHSEGFEESSLEAAGIELKKGEGPKAKDCILMPRLAGFFLENNTGAELANYSYMMDVKLSKADWAALFTSDYDNATDADLFIKGSAGTIGLGCGGLGYGGSIEAGQWYRIVVVMDYSKSKDEVISIYVDGNLVKRGTDRDNDYRQMNRWKIAEQGALFFIDDNAETSDIYVSNLTMWSVSLTEGQVAQLSAEPQPQELTIDALGCATAVYPEAVTVPEGLTAYVVESLGEGHAHAVVYAEAGATVKAGTPVIFRGAQGTYTLQLSDTEGTAPEQNLLQGNATENTGCADLNAYVLAANGTTPAFCPVAKAEGMYIPAGKAYLPVADGASPAYRLVFGDATGIGAATATAAPAVYYNLQGQPVKNPAKGQIYILNGKKIVNK